MGYKTVRSNSLSLRHLLIILLSALFAIISCKNEISANATFNQASKPAKKGKNPFCKDGRMLASLFVIGGMKCGTTALSYDLETMGGTSLDCGPRTINKSRCNEKHFFDNKMKVSQGLTRYGRQFKRCSSKSTFVSLDKSPSYIRVPQVPQALMDLYSPTMLQASTFVLILRDPVTRMISEYGHHKTAGILGNVKTFDSYAMQLLAGLRQKCPLYFSDMNSFDFTKCYKELNHGRVDRLPGRRLLGEGKGQPKNTMNSRRVNALLSGMFDLELKHWIDTYNFPASSLLLVSFKGYTSSGKARLEVLQTIFESVGLVDLAASLADNPKAYQLPQQLNSKARKEENITVRDQLIEFYQPHKLRTEQLILERELRLVPSMTEEEIRNGGIW